MLLIISTFIVSLMINNYINYITAVFCSLTINHYDNHRISDMQNDKSIWLLTTQLLVKSNHEIGQFTEINRNGNTSFKTIQKCTVSTAQCRNVTLILVLNAMFMVLLLR